MRYSQLFCFLLFLHLQATFSSFSSTATQSCSHEQSAALFQFKTLFSINKNASYSHNDTDGFSCSDGSYPKTNSWKEETDCCLWDGVSCDNITGQVISLDLSCSWLSGTFPSNNTLFLLSHLQSLDLSFNDFKKSRISSHFGRFLSLTHLDLSRSWFAGQIPHEISYMSKLIFLDLSSHSSSELILQAPEPLLKLEKSTLNRIVRNLTEVREIHLEGINMSSIEPNSFMNLSYSLTYLSLLGCDLRGNFPEEVFNLPNVENIDLSENPGLTGQLPRSNWSSPLEVLSLSGTSFYGKLPESIGNLKSLAGLGLIGCNFSGTIPSSLGQLSQLRFLFLSSNKFFGNIPSSLTSLSQLAILDLGNNQLDGYIPDQPNAFSNLEVLDLSYNLLNGKLPSWLYNRSTLSLLNLSNNKFIGHINEFQHSFFNNQLDGYIPEQPNAFLNLEFLDLSYNLLNGKLPSWLYNRSTLRLLELSNNKFIGHINEFQHSFLTFVNFKNNSFQGPIPTSISKLVNLTILDLSSNNLSGVLSLEVFYKLTNLVWLDLSSNTLSLSIKNNPAYIFPNLEYVNLKSFNINSEFPNFLKGSKLLKVLLLSNNSFTGDISDICKMKFLEILDLSHNNFSGVIPPCIGNFSQNLFSMNLKMNKLHGTIPPTFAEEYCGLKNLNLNGNHLEGPFTPSISSCKELEVLDVGNNFINGTFPHWIEELSELQVLVLHFNKLQGWIHVSKKLRTLSKLRIFDVSNNNFSGPLPVDYIRNFKGMIRLDEGKVSHYMGETDNSNYSYDYSASLVVKGLAVELVKILTIFTSFDLSSNKFEGEIPGILGGLNSLRGLNLSHNNLSGHIPQSLRNLTKLEWLDLSSNRLEGQIPRELVDLTFLSIFNVSNNQLIGSIPQGKQFNTFDSNSYQGNEGLCGLPLSRVCNNNQPPPPSIMMHRDHGPKIEFGWEVVVIGYGFGFIFGVVMDYVRLRKRLVS